MTEERSTADLKAALTQDEKLNAAIKQVQEEGLSIRKASTKFKISRSSLHRKIQQNEVKFGKKGPKSIFNENEIKGLIEVIIYRSKHGLSLSHDELRYLVREILLKRGDTIKDDFPNNKWIYRFIKSQKGIISSKKGIILSKKRYENSTKERIVEYFENISPLIKVLKPEQIWNCDETGICPQGRKPRRVISPCGMNANVQRSEDRENVSIMGCASAAGDSIPPMFIYSGKRKQTYMLDGAIPGSTLAMSDTSYINGNIFTHWIDWFSSKLDEKNIERPVLLILDGHFSHLTMKTIDYAREKSIQIFSLVSHTSQNMIKPLL